MKPDGRSLDIAVIGLGQAGGNLASEFFRRGYRALAFNTAQTDLAALEPGGVYPVMPSERCIYIGLDGYDGAGADPVYGRQCITENAERIRDTVMKHAAPADVVILAAGLGGGTGSALNEMVKVLSAEDLPLLAMMTLPTEGESGIAKVNAVKAINELVDAPLLGWIFIDNARIAALNPDVSIVDYYAHINGQIASPLDALNRLNDRETLRAIRSFDGEDFRKLLLAGGVLNYAVAELPSITTEEVVGTIRDAVEASEQMPGGFDMTRLSFVGVVIEATEAVLAATPISVFEEIDELLKSETHGAAVHNGIYRSSEEQPTTLRLICATQSLPHRIRQILADAKREGMVLGEKISQQLPTLELGEIERFELFRSSPRNRPSDRPRRAAASRAVGAIDDPVEHAGGPGSLEPPTEDGVQRKDLSSAPHRAQAPRVVRRRTPNPSTSRGADPEKATFRDPSEEETDQRTSGVGTREIDLPARVDVESRPHASDPNLTDLKDSDGSARTRRRGPPPPPDTGELPSPEIYDRLVADFRQAKLQRAREEVARRLEEDSISEQTVVRYYAVEAMSKLGRDVFATALLAATEDENEAVRAIAIEALRR